ncbi:MAG: hypothetical protein KKA19_04430 [Candidatus Margulisbacteria bacterium]|nr:hypothetical protein [Candidatus Margulisiibacteriota bacterium]
MFKFKIPDWEKAYIYLAIVAVGLVILFTWGQLSFFNWGQLREPSTGVSSTTEKTKQSVQKLQEFRETKIAKYVRREQAEGFTPQKQKGFFNSARLAFERLKQRRYVSELKKLEEKSPDEQEQAKVNMLLAEYYAFIEGDDEEAYKYYNKAKELDEDAIVGFPDLDWQSSEQNQIEQMKSFSSKSLVEIGVLYKSQGKPHLAEKSFTRVVKDYDRKSAQYRKIPLVSKLTRVALEEVAVLRAERGEAFPPYHSEASDPLEELQSIMEKVLESMLHNRPKNLLPLIPEKGVESMLEQRIKLANPKSGEHYSKEAMIYQFKKKIGPHYQQLFGWVKKNRIKAKDIKYWISQEEPNLYLVQIVYLAKNKTQKLYFQNIEGNWYLVFIGLD